MTQRTITPPPALSTAYVSLFEAFRDAVENAGGTVKLPSRAVSASFIERSRTTADFAWSFYLKNWPHRRLSRGQRLDLLVSTLEAFDTSPWRLTKSTVYMNSFIATSATTADLVQSLHFDFDSAGQDCHPYFHVQLSDELIPDAHIADLRDDDFDLTLRPAQGQDLCFVTMRIPTAEMTLASVMYCLVADHLPRAFPEFARRIHIIQNRLPPPGFDALRASLRRSRHFKSSHWFAHMANIA